MVVVLAKSIPDALRGKLKLWFIEIAPYVFVSCVKDSCAEKIVNFVWQYCDMSSELTIIRDINKPPFFEVKEKRFTKSDFVDVSGLRLKTK